MDSEKYCELVFDVLSSIDGYAVKSKRASLGSDSAWFEFVQGYAGILASAKVSPQDIKPAALHHVQKSQYFPTPAELIEIAKVFAYERYKDMQIAARALPAPQGEPITDELRAAINERMTQAEEKLAGQFATMLRQDREAIRAEYVADDPSLISPARKKSIEEARLRLERGGAA